MTVPTSGAVRRAALERALGVLACPRCLASLRRAGQALACGNGHAFDVARQGYAALAPGATVRGDTAAMVRARIDLLGSGAFAAVTRAVIATVPEGAGRCVDLAGGPGSHLAQVLDARPDLVGLSLDVSAAAARAAAGAHERLASATADLTGTLPIRDAAATHVLGIFGPRNGSETARILAPAGTVTIVTPLPEHLAQLREPFGTLGIGSGKAHRVDEQLAPLRRIATTEVRDRRLLGPGLVAAAVLMGPSGHHLDESAVRSAAARIGAVEVGVAVTVTTYGSPS